MTRIRMLKTIKGSHNGTEVNTYEAGQVYDQHSHPPMSVMLATIFLRDGMAEDADAVAVPAEPQPELTPQARAGKKIGPSETKDATADDPKTEDAPAS